MDKETAEIVVKFDYDSLAEYIEKEFGYIPTVEQVWKFYHDIRWGFSEWLYDEGWGVIFERAQEYFKKEN